MTAHEDNVAKAVPATRGVVPDWLATFGGIALVVAAYRTIFSLAFAWGPRSLGMDNVADNIWAQQFRLVYQLRQPPLFEWLLWPLQQAIGPTSDSFLIVKGVILTLTAVFLFGAARYAIKDRRIAAVTVLSYGLFYNVAWTMLERLPQSALLLCCCAATAWTFARALSTSRALDYAMLGLAFGAGLLAKFNFALFGLSLLATSLTEPLLRRRLKSVGIALTAAVAAAVTSPFVYGLISDQQPLFRSVAKIMLAGEKAPYLARVSEGLSRLGLSLVEFSLALIPLMLLVFWKSLRAGDLPTHDETAAYARLFGKASAIAAGLAVVGIILSGSVYVLDWHVLPIFATLPLWMFARIEAGGVSPDRMRTWTRGLTGIVILCAALRAAGEIKPDAAYCGRCTALKSYPELARDLVRLGAGGGTLVALDPYTAGNLRSYLPLARILVPGFSEPRRAGLGPDCFAVWETSPADRPTPLEEALPAAGYASVNLAGSGQDAFFTHYWPKQWFSGFGRSTTWGMRQLDPQAPVCR
jgi:Dolichyl-phosphate-mannose-protein mannosyltransferase